MTQASDHIEGHCPKCHAKWRLRAEVAGRRVRCKQCSEVFRVDAPPGRTAGGPLTIPGYKIKKELGHGGMGRVYLARQLATKRPVALKVMLEGRYADEQQRRRFEREVEIAASLEHPNIARIYASGLHRGHHWFAMEYVEGDRLDKRLSRRKLGIPDLLKLFVSICEGVNYAHRRGVIHRDLKPGNIMVDTDGQPRVLDFGLAKFRERPAGATTAGLRSGRSESSEADPIEDLLAGLAPPETEERLSMPGQVMGTPAYMSPEQTQGIPELVDVRSDVYSLGVILYRLLTGQSPYARGGEPRSAGRGRAGHPSPAREPAGLPELLRTITEHRPTPPRRVHKQVPAEVSAIVMKALEKDPEERYQTAGELGRDIEAYLAGDPVTAKQGSGWYMLRKTALRYRKAGAAIAAVIVLSLSLGMTMSIMYTRTKTRLTKYTREVSVLKERKAAPDPALAAGLANTRAEAERLRLQLDEQANKNSKARSELERLQARATPTEEFNPPPPNPANPVNYIEWMNNTFGLENAADDYRAAFERIEKFEGTGEDQEAFDSALAGPWSGNAKLSRWLTRNRDALTMFREAAAKPKCWYPLSTKRPGQEASDASADPRLKDLTLGILLPWLSGHRTAPKALLIEGWRAWQAGDQRRLPENALVILRSSHHLESQPFVIDRLVAIACQALAYDSLANALELSKDPGALATRLLPQLNAADPAAPDFRRYVALERMNMWDICQRFYVPGTQPGSWALYEPGLKVIEGEEWEADEAVQSLKRWFAETGVGFDQTMRELNACYDAFDEWCRTPYHLTGDRIEDWERSVKESTNWFVRTLVPSLSRARLLDERGIAQRRATHLIVCLFAYHAANGRFPRTLAELDAPDLADLRIDPFSGKDFVYKRIGEDFTLYSVAGNFKDDGGRHHPKWGEKNIDGDHIPVVGDYVFWPVQDGSQHESRAGEFSHTVTFRTTEKAPADFDAWMFTWIVPDYDRDAKLDYVVLEPDGEEHFRLDLTGAAPGQRTRSDFKLGFAGGDPAVFHGQYIRFRVRTTKGEMRFQNAEGFEFLFYRATDDGEIDWRAPFARIKAVVQR